MPKLNSKHVSKKINPTLRIRIWEIKLTKMCTWIIKIQVTGCVDNTGYKNLTNELRLSILQVCISGVCKMYTSGFKIICQIKVSICFQTFYSFIMLNCNEEVIWMSSAFVPLNVTNHWMFVCECVWAFLTPAIPILVLL